MADGSGSGIPKVSNSAKTPVLLGDDSRRPSGDVEYECFKGISESKRTSPRKEYVTRETVLIDSEFTIFHSNEVYKKCVLLLPFTIELSRDHIISHNFSFDNLKEINLSRLFAEYYKKMKKKSDKTIILLDDNAGQDLPDSPSRNPINFGSIKKGASNQYAIVISE
jgi:hypothetical protein